MLRKYETLFIIKPDLPEEQFESIRSRATTAIQTNGGQEIAYQDWGKRKLAYSVAKHLKGNYIYFRYLSGGQAVAELERMLKVNDDVLRYLTVKLADRVDPEGFDFELEAASIFPFNVKPREPREERKEGDDEKKDDASKDAKDEEKKEAPAEKPAAEAKAADEQKAATDEAKAEE